MNGLDMIRKRDKLTFDAILIFLRTACRNFIATFSLLCATILPVVAVYNLFTDFWTAAGQLIFALVFIYINGSLNQ
jgi:hypothetical protein